MPVQLSEAAAADLEAIFHYGAEHFGEEIAEDYVRGFQAAFDTISEYPKIGSVHDLVRPPIYSLSHGSHRIFYDLFSNRVVVQRVLHKTMDVKRWL
jgi:toxin ParE1/3/4